MKFRLHINNFCDKKIFCFKYYLVDIIYYVFRLEMN